LYSTFEFERPSLSCVYYIFVCFCNLIRVEGWSVLIVLLLPQIYDPQIMTKFLYFRGCKMFFIIFSKQWTHIFEVLEWRSSFKSFFGSYWNLQIFMPFFNDFNSYFGVKDKCKISNFNGKRSEIDAMNQKIC
jgi:hypothetical protein